MVSTSTPNLRIVNVELLDSLKEILGGLKNVEEILDQVIIEFLQILDIMNHNIAKDLLKHHI